MAKILLVEDDKSLREIYGVRLLAEGYDIVSAGDGEEALAMAIKEKPQLIISDVMMPKISGFDMLDILRSTTETRDIKVIMMTALSSDDQRTRGEQLGADKYLVKSQVGIEDVVRTVHEVLGDTAGGAKAEDKPAEAAASATSASDAASPSDTSSTPAADSAAPASDTPTTDSTTTAAAPGNDDAGPLPPQPSEVKPEAPVVEEPQPTESTLPQPTAPFSSPRPANLGENVVHPDAGGVNTDASTTEADSLGTVAPDESAQLHNELQATSDPITTQVDTPDDQDVSPVVQPPVAGDLTATDSGSGLNFEAPAAPGAPATDTPTSEDDRKDDPQSPISTSAPL